MHHLLHANDWDLDCGLSAGCELEIKCNLRVRGQWFVQSDHMMW